MNIKEYLPGIGMAVIIVIIIIGGLFSFAFKPSDEVVDYSVEGYELQDRIRVIQHKNIGGTIFYIINIDGKEYLTQKDGGIIKLRD